MQKEVVCIEGCLEYLVFLDLKCHLEYLGDVHFNFLNCMCIDVYRFKIERRERGIKIFPDIWNYLE